MKILHVVSCCLLLALCVVESAVINVKDVVGGQVKIKCSHTWAGDNEKYFCKLKCYHRDRLVQTEGNNHYIEKERYTIEDLRNGVFYVTIKDLRKSDSGTYWCGVERYGPDSYQEVHLIVTDATTSKLSAVTPRPHVSTSLLKLSTTSPNISTTFLASGDVSGHSSSRADSPPLDSPGAGQSQRAGDVMFSGVGLGVVLLLLGLLLFMFFRERRDRDRKPTASKHSARLLVPDSMTTNQDPDTGTIANPIYATATNHNPDKACNIATIYSTATNPCPDDIHFNVGPSSEVRDSVTYATVNFPRDPA